MSVTAGKTVVKQLVSHVVMLIWLVSMSNYSQAQGAMQSIINLTCDSDISLGILEQQLPEQFSLEHITFSADVFIDTQELENFFVRQAGTHITQTAFKQALWYIKQKRKFEQAILTFNQTSSGYILHVELQSSWTFFKLYITGMLIGKDQYRHYYLLESGEVFNEHKHYDGIAKIKEALRTQGYHSPVIIDTLLYYPETKSISVTLALNEGQRYVIDDVLVKLTATEPLGSENLESLQAHVRRFLLSDLKDTYYSQDTLNDAARSLKRYLARKGFFDASIALEEKVNEQQACIKLILTITLSHKKACEFIGNHFLSEDQLLEALLSFGKAAFIIPPFLLAEELTNMYKKKGFWDVQVAWREEPEHLFFVIQEGPRASVDKIALEGADTLSSQQLISNCFSEFLKLGYFDSDALKQALDRLTQQYAEEGFWDMAIIKKDYTAPDKPNRYTLTLKIEEGPRRWLRSVTIEGFERLLEEGPFAPYAHISTPMPFNLHVVQEQQQWLTRYFQQQGYLYITPKPELRQDATHTTILTWKLNGEYEPVRFGKTIIAGSNRLQPYVVLRELQYHEGDIWDKNKLDASTKQLKALGIFDAVSLSPINITQPERFKTLLLQFREDDPFEIRTRIGAQVISKNFTFLSGAGYLLGGSLLWKNPTQTADMLELDVEFARHRRYISAWYTMPWLFKYPIRTTIRGYSFDYERPIITGSKERLYSTLHEGIMVELDREYSRGMCQLAVGFEWRRISGLTAGLLTALDINQALADLRVPIFFIEPTITINYLDNALDPHSGSLTLMSVKGMVPLYTPSTSLVKFLIEQSFFAPLYSSVIFAFRMRYGHIFNTLFLADILPSERFYLGGSTSLRGYEPDSAQPVNIYHDGQGKRHEIARGGKSMANINLELRFPIYTTLPGSINGVIFTDMGILSDNIAHSLNTESIIGSSGFGLRYNTALGPLRFDIGWKWKKFSPEDSRFGWILTLGHAF